MEIARTSMTHARAPHFLWPYTVRYAAHQRNLWPRVSRPEASPTSLWTGSPGAASRFRVRGCLALVRDTSADKISPRAISCVFLGFPEDSSDYTFYHPPLHRFFDSRDVRFDESVPYYVRCSLLPRSPPPSLQQTGFRCEDIGGASSRGAGVGAESVPVRDPGSGGAGVGAEPVTAGDSSLRGAGVSGAGVSGAVPGSATTGGAPSAGPGEPRTDPVTSGGAGSGGGARVRRAREERLELEREERELERQQLELQRLEEQQQQPEQEQPQQQQQPPPSPISGLRTLGLPSPSPPSPPPSPPVSGTPLPPPDPSPAVFPPPLPPLSSPLSHIWPSRCSPRARPSSPVPFTDLCTALFCSSPPRLSPSILPSPPESALTASLSTPVTDYYRTYRPVLSRALASLVTDPRASLSSVSTLTAAVAEFASTRCLDYATSLVAAPPTSPLAVGGESALGCDALEDRQFELEFLAATSPHLCAMLLAPEGDPDALDIPTPRTYAEAVLQRFELQHSTVQRTPLAIDHRLTGPFPDEPFEPSGPYAELVGCLMYLMTCNRPDLVLPLSILARFLALGRHRPVHWTAAVRVAKYLVAKYLVTTSGVGLVLGGREDVVLTGHCDSSYADDAEMHRSTQGYCFSLGSGAVSWRSTRSSLVSTSTTKAEIYAGAMAAQELRKLTFLLTDLSERPSFAPTLFTDNKATILLCREPRLESRVKHINVRYFLLRDLQRRGQARFDFVESEANTADIFTKALPPWLLSAQHSYADDAETHKSTQGYCFSLGSGAVSWRSTRSSSISTSTTKAEIYAGAMTAQELRKRTFLLTDLSERPSSAPTLFTDNKATILLCPEPRLESRVKHINVRYFLLRELQRRGQACFDFVESEANTADIFTKALPPCDHQRCCVQ
ncbi:unnamed protein product [Closterium sp. NIES-54]